MQTSYLSLGSNIDDRMEHLLMAEKKLSNQQGIEIIKFSKIYETSPWVKDEDLEADDTNQPLFLNQVIQIETSLNPEQLLEVCQQIEKELGRQTKGDYAPRTLDIDILLYGHQVIESDHLVIPHRHMVDRRFVLIPLLEISPELQDPNSGKSFKYFLQNIKDNHKIETYL